MGNQQTAYDHLGQGTVGDFTPPVIDNLTDYNGNLLADGYIVLFERYSTFQELNMTGAASDNVDTGPMNVTHYSGSTLNTTLRHGSNVTRRYRARDSSGNSTF